MKNLVVMQVVQQRRRRAIAVAGHEDGRAADAMRRVGGNVREELIEWIEAFAEPHRQQRAALFPRREQHVDDHADGEREPAALQDLGEVGGQEPRLNYQECACERTRHHAAGTPRAARHEIRQHGRDDHGRRHRNTVGGGNGTGAAKADDQAHARHHQRPIDLRNVDLPLVAGRGVLDAHAGAITKLDGLVGHREHARDQRL